MPTEQEELKLIVSLVDTICRRRKPANNATAANSRSKRRGLRASEPKSASARHGSDAHS
jgi:hypothetical protein